MRALFKNREAFLKPDLLIRGILINTFSYIDYNLDCHLGMKNFIRTVKVASID